MDKRFYFLIVGFLFLSIWLTANNQIVEAKDTPIDSSNLPIFNLENATFVMGLNSSSLTRGEDDLLIFFQYTYENDTYIEDSYIQFNITNPSVEVIYEDTILLNKTSTGYYNKTVSWSTFNSQDAGNYTVYALANSTTTSTYNTTETFELIVLDSARLRMYFQSSRVSLNRGENNDIPFIISNAGGTTAINVTVSTTIYKTGTVGSITRSISISNIEINSGESILDYIGFYPDDCLFQKHSFQLSYRSIDDPGTEIVTESETLEIIVEPNIDVDREDVFIPINATIGEEYIIEYEIVNNEGESWYILPNAESDNIEFDIPEESIRVTPGANYLTIVGVPFQDGSVGVFFEIDIEWTTVLGTKWKSPLLITIFDIIFIEVANIPEPPSTTANIAYSVVFTSLLLGLIYFSRDLFLGITNRAQLTKTRIFPEVNYPFETAILDGSNIAWEEKNPSNKPKIANIESMINRLSRANFKKIITVADAALRYQIDEQKRLDQLVKEGAIKMLPARVDGDKFILRLADEENAAIVSNDMFKEFREDSPWIDERRIPYTILEGEVYLHPTSASPSEHSQKESEEEKKGYKS